MNTSKGLVSITEKSRRKMLIETIFFFFCFLHSRRGLALWRSSYLTKCFEVWAQNWDFATQCCKSKATVHTQVLVWILLNFLLQLYSDFCLPCATAVTLPGTRWLLKFWICSLGILDVTPTEKLCLLKAAIKNVWKRDSSSFLVCCLRERLAVETVKPKACMLYIWTLALGWCL